MRQVSTCVLPEPGPTLLALVPYALLRGPFNRLARLFLPANAPPPIGNGGRRNSQRGNEQGKAETYVKRTKGAGLVKTSPNGNAQRRLRRGRRPARRYGPIFPKSPACYGFSILAKIIPGREEVFYDYAKTIEKTIAAQPDALAVLTLHYLRWVLFPIKGETYFMYQGIFDTDFDIYTEDAIALFGATGVSTVFENLEGFPTDWRTNAPAFIKFVRDHQWPSFLEYGEYPYVSADEIKKALKLKAAFSNMLDQMQ
jgi:hypothetical protein